MQGPRDRNTEREMETRREGLRGQGGDLWGQRQASRRGGPRCRDVRDLDREGEMGTRGGDEDRWRHRDIGVTETERWGERADDRE